MSIRKAFPLLSLSLIGVVLTLVGLFMGFWPAQVTLGSLGHTTATSSVRVFGGFHLGLGLLAVVCIVRPTLRRPGLTAIAIILGCGLVFRFIGVALDGDYARNFIPLERESFGFALTIASLWVMASPSMEIEVRMPRILSQAPRFVLGAISIFSGVTGLIAIFTGADLFAPPMSAQMHGFIDPLTAFVPFWAFLKTLQAAGGLALLVKPLGPLGALTLAPIVAVIAISQVLLNAPAGIVIGVLFAALEAWCLWSYREHYRPILVAPQQA